MDNQFVYVLISYSNGIHAIYSTEEKAQEAKITEDYDLGCSGSLYETSILKMQVL